MAKGRKLTTSRSERLLGSYNYGNNTHETAGAEAGDLPDFGEEDVWSLVDNMVNAGDHSITGNEWSSRSPSESIIKSRRRVARDEDGPHVGGLSLAFDNPSKTTSSPRIVHQFRGGQDNLMSPRGRHHVATSAPVNVPDWSKIYRVDSVESMHDSDDGIDDQDLDMVPPHEYLVRSRMTAANSVFEGVGRTLKGQDMSRVRDAVWDQTGFDG